MQKNVPLIDIVDDARNQYVAARPKSAAIHGEACKHLPGGNTRTVLYYGPFPLRAERGEGAYIWDVDGNRHLNLLGEYTAGVFGHSHPVIMDSIQRALSGGVNLSAHSEAEARLGELVTERFPALESVRFTNSGTEANLMAVATARHATGRTKIMVFHGGYHGGLLAFGDGGIPINAPYEFIVAPYNDIEATRALIQENADALSCVLLEAMLGTGGCIPATEAFLKMIREETKTAGALMILDEVMTSRFGRHGAGAVAGVTPDLMTIGKWVAGGMTFGAYGGRRDLMAIYDPGAPGAMPHAGTFNNNIVSMTAGVTALGDVFTSDAAEELHARGERLRKRLNDTFERHDVALHFSGKGSLMNLHGMAGPVESPRDLIHSDDRLKELVFFDLLERGYYMARRGFIALTMVVTEEELDGFVAALEDVLDHRRAVLPPRK